ncbi:MAG TPA: TAT-variant-translocated molybdopterin oxidoreductase [Rhodanobacteraceae bacterium]|nr:TAT-variant-translocated molybdopterin oxidoreductase [Rhodanobacteraceae bacterium]
MAIEMNGRTSFDMDAARARLRDVRGPKLWRSLEELADSEGFRAWLQREHPQFANAAPLDRRGFLKFIGASLALAGLSACSRPPQSEIVPYVHGQVGQVDGLPRYFATTLMRNGFAQGVLVRSNEGRPTKVEGNPQHPASLGGTDIFAQASVLQLWDPDRSQSVLYRDDATTWDEFAMTMLQARARWRPDGGAGLRVLTGAITSPTLAAQLDALQKQYPNARWHLHEPCSNNNAREGARLAFGKPYATRYRFDRAKVILALDADFLSDPAAGVRYSRDFIAARDPERGAMSRLYAVEPTPTVTGMMADHRLPLESAQVEVFAQALAERLGVAPGRSTPVRAKASQEPNTALRAGREQARSYIKDVTRGPANWLDALAADLKGNHGASLIVVGTTQPPESHALVHAMNAALGNIGNTLEYIEPVEALPSQSTTPNGNDDGSLRALVGAMRAGRVDTLLVLGGNPIYDAPADLEFAAALQRVPHLLHLGLYHDETGELAEWHLPQAHPLEAWGDARAFDGTASIGQPLIAPLYDGKSAIEVLSILLDDEITDGRALVRRQWSPRLKDDAAWNAALQSGVIAGTAMPASGVPPHPPGASRLPPSLHGEEGNSKAASQEGDSIESSRIHPIAGSFQSAESRGTAGSSPFPLWEVGGGEGANNDRHAGEKLELLFRPDPTIGNGEWANNGWLQELPKPLTQLTWDNPALISPALAKQYGLDNGDVVELQSRGHELRIPVWIMPGQAARSLTVHLGYGRTRAGRIGDGQGFNAYLLRTSQALWESDDLQLRKTGEHCALAPTQHHFNMEGRDLLRTGTLADFLHDPHFATANDKYAEPPPSLYPDYPKGDYAWGMSIDLNACIGCKACTIACQAENNIPVVGKEETRRGREMHWIRVDRYYEGEAENPRALNQPVPCMMCEHAPCELVCPVDATVHDSEGLNVQVYNRCVGTRFCSNNCPYKVRRFNFMQYADKETPQPMAVRNPEVTVRRRGVMEKCTYCIQRIETAHIEADKSGRRIADGDVLTACQAVCPTQAIRFGDISDKESGVSKAKASPRNYAMLNELGTRPRTTYLARLRNPNPALKDGPT